MDVLTTAVARVALVVLLLLPGCAALGNNQYYPLREMTADQIKAATASKESSATCIYANYGPASATTVIINSDKGVPAGVTIKPNCETTFDTKVAAPPGTTTVPVHLQVVPR